MPVHWSGISAAQAEIQKMQKHGCATRGGTVSQDLEEIKLYMWAEVGISRADFYFGEP